MDTDETKTCDNCNREIPAVNFTIHSVHCTRNIKLCPVCKEPVPQDELNDHHHKLHQLLPCKQCGDNVCGTDLEDHLRDSCGLTVKSCRFCELELPRRELPSHEGYCGTRTEQCPDCLEWVMIRYTQLHRDSNHGFIRLDDDPVPKLKNTAPSKLTNTKPFNLPSTDNSSPQLRLRSKNETSNVDVPNRTEIRHYTRPNGSGEGALFNGVYNEVNLLPQSSITQIKGINEDIDSLTRKSLKSNNIKPLNIPSSSTSSLDRQASEPRTSAQGAVKKRPAPKPPIQAPPGSKQDTQYRSSLTRKQVEERQIQKLTARNIANGRVFNTADILKHGQMLRNNLKKETSRSNGSKLAENSKKRQNNESQNDSINVQNLKPMSHDEFMNRFRELRLRGDQIERSDRFSEIKTSLRELRRGLNEVTAPYNSNSNSTQIDPNVNRESQNTSPAHADSISDVELPCEFCYAPVLASELVLHQTGCRPDLTQQRHREPSPPPVANDVPLIPCEFCGDSLPVYMVTEHQELCRRSNNILFPD